MMAIKLRATAAPALASKKMAGLAAAPKGKSQFVKPFAAMAKKWARKGVTMATKSREMVAMPPVT